MTKSKKLAVIILQYNNYHYTYKCLKSIAKNTKNIENYRFILIDNASTDEGKDILLSEASKIIPDIEVYQNKENLGFAGAHNKIVRKIENQKMIFLNNDTELLNDALNLLVNSANDDSVNIATGILVNPDGSKQPNTKGYYWYPSPFKRVLNHMRHSKRGVRRVFYINGALLYITKKLFEDVGGFSEKYFMYTEDLDLMVKLNRTKEKMYQYSEPLVMHHGGGSSDMVWTAGEKEKLQHKQANSLIIENYGFLQYYIFVIVWLALWLPKGIYAFFLSKQSLHEIISRVQLRFIH